MVYSLCTGVEVLLVMPVELVDGAVGRLISMWWLLTSTTTWSTHARSIFPIMQVRYSNDVKKTLWFGIHSPKTIAQFRYLRKSFVVKFIQPRQSGQYNAKRTISIVFACSRYENDRKLTILFQSWKCYFPFSRSVVPSSRRAFQALQFCLPHQRGLSLPPNQWNDVKGLVWRGSERLYRTRQQRSCLCRCVRLVCLNKQFSERAWMYYYTHCTPVICSHQLEVWWLSVLVIWWNTESYETNN